MASKLSLYNQALVELGSAPIATLADTEERRYALDQVYDGIVAECLEEGYWNFAEKSVEIEYDNSISPTFGYQYAFLIPSDYVRLSAMSANEYYNPPLTQYHTESGYWWADVTPLYVRYISNANDYGLDLSLWPASFEKYVVYALAEAVCMRITQSDTKRETLVRLVDRQKKNARSKDAMNQPSITRPQSNWLNTRFGDGNYRGRRYERA